MAPASGPDASAPTGDGTTHIDYRFSLANERTFLAWNRTALSLVAGGLAVVHLLDSIDPPAFRRALGVPIMLFGALLAGVSFSRWERNEEAMRADRALPGSILPRLLALGVLVGGIAAVVLVMVGDVQ